MASENRQSIYSLINCGAIYSVQSYEQCEMQISACPVDSCTSVNNYSIYGIIALHLSKKISFLSLSEADIRNLLHYLLITE